MTPKERALVCYIHAAQRHVAELDANPENRATAIALEDARRWQEAREAMRASAGPAGEHPQGLGWCEV
jgi:hypothetical protein